MPVYNPPLRDMQFVIHELLNLTEELKPCQRHADLDVDTINAVLEEGGKFASEVTFPLNKVGDVQGCTLDKETHEVKTPDGYRLGPGRRPPQGAGGRLRPALHQALRARPAAAGDLGAGALRRGSGKPTHPRRLSGNRGMAPIHGARKCCKIVRPFVLF